MADCQDKIKKLERTVKLLRNLNCQLTKDFNTRLVESLKLLRLNKDLETENLALKERLIELGEEVK